MKKVLILFSILILISCGSNDKKKKGFEYNRTQKEIKQNNTSETNDVPIDLNNKGIGPIKELVFDDAVNKTMADEGKKAFILKCTACHMAERKLIGPAMKGIYERRSPEWVINLLLNPTQMLKEDPIAIALLKKYNNILMLNQNLTQKEARAISEYLRTL